MNSDDFTFIARLLKERSGLVLTKDKGYLVQNRLAPVVREHGLNGLSDLIARLRGGDTAAATQVVEAMMSKDTAFFRDWRPFKHLTEVALPAIRSERLAKRHLRILSAGCSTGQEAYSIAMLVQEEAKAFAGWQVDITAIDLSASAIASCERGRYSQFDVQRGLPIRRLLRHFHKAGEAWQIAPSLQRMVSFRTWSLLDELYPLGRFDVILCRNVLIAFDQQTKAAVLQKLGRLLADDGVFYVGAAESVTGVSASFRPSVPVLGIYTVHREGPSTARSNAAAHA